MKNLVLKISLIFLFFGSQYSKADHIVGNDITYKCSKTNDSIYTIIFNFYRDCNGCYVLGQSPKCGTSENCNSSQTAPTTLTLSCVGGADLGTISMTRTSITDITKTCKKEISKCQQPCNGSYPYGIERHTFEGTVDLRQYMKRGCCRFKISVTLWVRGAKITTGMQQQLFFTFVEFDACKKPCNASPQLTNDPVAIICCNQPYFFNNGAVDTVNYDSLSYRLAPAYQSSTNQVTYTSPFSPTYPLTVYFPTGWTDKTRSSPDSDPPIGIFLDPITGDLIFTPVECDQQAVVVMQIDEWRKNSKGVYENIGITRRDMQFIVQTCPGNNPPKITNKVFKYSICAGTQLCFDITTEDKPFVPPPPAKTPDPDTVTLSWNRGIPGATFIIKNNKAREKVATFCWTPKKNQASDLPYTFTATAIDDACPKNALTTRSFSIVVKPIAEAKRNVDTLICGKYSFESKPYSNFKYPAAYLWKVSDSNNQSLSKQYYTFKSNNALTSNKIKDTITFRKGGKYIIHHRINNVVNCPTDYFDTLIVPPLLEVDLALGPDTFVCAGTTLRLGAKVVYGVPNFKYQWFTPINFNKKDSLTYIDVTMSSHDSTFRVEISDNNKCTAYDTINVFLKPNPKVDMGPDLRICWYGSVTLTPKAKNAYWINPTLGDTLKQGDTLWWKWKRNGIDFSTDTFAKFKKRGVYMVTVVDSLGCAWTDTMNLYVNDTLYPNAGPDQTKCFNDTLVLRASGLDTVANKKSGTYLWYKGLPKTPPYFSTAEKAKFVIKTSDSYLLELQVKEDTVKCYGYDTVKITVNSLPTLTLISPQKYCCDYGNIPLGSSAFASPTGGTWSCRQNSSLISGNNFLTPQACNPTKVGVFTLIYTYTDPVTTCINKDSTRFTVNPLPSLKFDGGTICQNAEEVLLKPFIKAPLNLNSMVDVQFRLLQGIAKTGGGNVTLSDIVYDNDLGLNYDFRFIVSKKIIDLQGKNKDSIKLEISIQNGDGCNNKDTAWFYIIGLPIITFSGFPDLCIDAGIVNLSTISNTQPLTGKWTVIDSSSTKAKAFLQVGLDNNNGDTLNTNKLSIINGPGLYKLRYTDISTGCYIKKDTVIRINPLPNVTISISPTGDKGKFCEIDPDVTLNASPTGGVWTSSVAGVIFTDKFRPTAVQPTDRDKWFDLTYTYIHPSTKCDTSKSLKVFVQNKPIIDIITPDLDTCRSNITNIKLTASYKFTTKINWVHSANPLRASFESNNQLSNLNPTTYTIKPRSDSATRILITSYTEAEGVCPFAQDAMNITIHPKPHGVIKDSSAGCVPLLVNFTSTINNGVDFSKASYLWTFGEPTDATTQNSSHTYNNAGPFDVKLKITSEFGCDSTLGPLKIKAYPIPVAGFTPNPNNRTPAALSRFRFTNESSTKQLILGSRIAKNIWDFGYPNLLTDTSTKANPEYYYHGDTGRYMVRLIVVTNHGCSDIAERLVIIDPDMLVFIPNAFSPDGAGPLKNDKFWVEASGYDTYQILIFNRWGEKIYESHRLDEPWDGKYQGELVQMDAYVYEVQITSFIKKLYKYSGTVILIR